MTSRRKFLKYGLIGTAGAIATYSGVKWFMPFKKVITSILTEDLKGLKVSTTDIETFAGMAAKTNPWRLKAVEQKMLSFYDPALIRKLPLPYIKKYNTLRTDVVATFLLSTDFFSNKMDEQKEITYSGKIWNPYTSPCQNPFSALYYKL